MSLKDFLIKSLQSHNCEADLEVLSDYILALLDNGTNPSDLPSQLQDFLHDETSAFINELNEFLASQNNTNTVNKDENEVEVDYEDDGIEDEGITSSALRLPQRTLREYSPERRDQSFKPNHKTPQICTNFFKKGNCRFGDNCRYAHIQQQRNTPILSRLKLTNLPQSLLNPAEITKEMSKYGKVTDVTVFPENLEASVQFSSGEEAQKAFNEFEYDVKGEEGIVIELENNKQEQFNNKNEQFNSKHEQFNGKQEHFNSKYEQFNRSANPNYRSSSPSQDLNLQSLINLQKRQQSILESNLTVQQTLLNSLQNPALTEPERLESLSTLNSIQESVMQIQGMLKRTTEMVVEAAAKGMTRSKSSYQTQAYQKQPIKHGRTFSQKSNNQYLPNKYVASSNPTSTPSHSLDLRSTTLILTPLSSTNLVDIRSLQRHFTPYGLIQSLKITEEGRTALIKYQKYGDAVKALENAGKDFDKESVEFSFLK